MSDALPRIPREEYPLRWQKVQDANCKCKLDTRPCQNAA